MATLSGSTASLRVLDHATGQTVTLTVDQFCDRTEIQEFTDQELQKAGVGASITFEGGRWHISYRVLNVTSENGMETHEVTREELPLDEVRRRVENVRAEERRAG